jgi:hypothetical protein
MSASGRPKGEYRSAQHDGTAVKPDSPSACMGTAAVTLLAIAAFFFCIASNAPAAAVEFVAAAQVEANGGCE